MKSEIKTDGPFLRGKRPSPLYIPQRRSLTLPPRRMPKEHPPFPRLWMVLVIFVPAGWLTIMGVAWLVVAVLQK